MAGVDEVVCGVVSAAFPPGYSGMSLVVTGRGGSGGGVVGGVTIGKVEAEKVAIVESITVCLASPSAPLTFGRLLELRPPVALARIAGLMTPVFTTAPVTLAKLLGPTVTTWVSLVTATWPART